MNTYAMPTRSSLASQWEGMSSNLFDIFNVMNDLAHEANSSYASNFPPANVFINEESGELVLELAVAGYRPQDIEIMLTGDDVRIKSNAVTQESAKRQVIKQGIKARAFECKYKLASGKFDTEGAAAEFENGLLRITIPAAKHQKPRLLKLDVKQLT